MLSERGPTLAEAARWIAAHRGKTMLVKLGGDLMSKTATLDRLIPQIVVLRQCGIRPVLVHGGGIQVDQACRDRGIEIRKINGRRITSPEVMTVMRDVIGRLNSELVSRLGVHGIRAEGFPAAVLCTRRPPTPLPDGSVVDWGEVGDVVRFLEDESPSDPEVVAVYPCLGRLEDGAIVNVNADTVAAHVATGLGAEKLVFLTNVSGVMHHPDDAGPISDMTIEDTRALLDSQIATGGMRAKLEEALRALAGGVKTVHIVSGKDPYTLLRELFTAEGCGTQIRGDGREGVSVNP